MAVHNAAAPMTAKEFQNHLNVSRENMDRLTIYADRLLHWNNRINLVGGATTADLWRRHMLDSAQLIERLPPQATELIDLGSGAGFPGLVLATLSGLRAHLVESDARKAAFLGEVVRLTDAPATVHQVRIEDLEPIRIDVVIARALAPLPKLLEYSSPILEFSAKSAPVCLFLKGSKWREELTMAQKEWNMRVDSLASISDPTGRVLVIDNVSRKESAP